jgi:Icc-related predicted phosphoesterase
MRVHVVSDVHGNSQALAKAGDGADALVVLGDLVDFVDYHDHSGGILGAVFGADVVARFARLRTSGAPGDLRRFAQRLWDGLADPRGTLEDAVREQYARLFGVLTAPTYLTPGNVDLPHLWPEFLGPGVRTLDGEVAEIGGLRFGFVGGLPLPPGIPVPDRAAAWRPYLRSQSDFDAACGALTEVDVLCSHVPPSVADLAYDVCTRKAESSSAALLAVARRDRPRAALFGHVHQPLAPRARVGVTECVNVGHFQRTERPWVLTW